jgi:hypothetical protein
MLARVLAKQNIDDPRNYFTFQNFWSPSPNGYDLQVDFQVWQAVHEMVRRIGDLTELGQVASSEAFNTGYMPILVAQFSAMAPSLTCSCLEAAAILATVQAMLVLLPTPNAKT